MRRNKLFITAILQLLNSFFGIGQINLVPNPSFEDTIACPSAAGEINKAFGWTTLCGSPDYYNTCNANPYDMSVPQNWAGYQYPASGNAYVGFLTYSDALPNSREFPTSNLASPLIIGIKYFISFKVALTVTSYFQVNCATNKIGALFATSPYGCNALITNNPQVYTDTIVTDSINWTRITGSFLADSAYTYMVIGNFFDDINTDTTKFFNGFSDNAYYFLDDICLSTDSVFASNYNYLDIMEKSSQIDISCYPNPISEKLTIKNKNKSKQAMNIEIYNSLGELLVTFIDVTEEAIELNLADVSIGILYLKVKTGERISSFKLIKQ